MKKGKCAVAAVELGQLFGRGPEGFEEILKKMVNG